MNHRLALIIVSEIQTLLALVQSPDARWDAVQAWLKRNPRWQQEINHYLNVTPDEAVGDLRDYLIEQTEIPQSLATLVITPQLEAQARSAIEKLQTLYKERANNQTEKEIKNVRRKPARRMDERTRNTN